jgi:hypothetical protein
MGRIIFFLSIILTMAFISSCCLTKKTGNVNDSHQVSIPGPKLIIYQTKNDYSKLVPVILSDDKKTLVSYPDIKDIYYNGNLAYPTQLHNGYLLDNRGIDQNVAFIKLTYEEYAKLAKTPTPDQLMEMIVDKDPLSKMYSCGIKTSSENTEQELNLKLDKGDFSTFIKIK